LVFARILKRDNLLFVEILGLISFGKLKAGCDSRLNGRLGRIINQIDGGECWRVARELSAFENDAEENDAFHG
jgi:hypothetical protein